MANSIYSILTGQFRFIWIICFLIGIILSCLVIFIKNRDHKKHQSIPVTVVIGYIASLLIDFIGGLYLSLNVSGILTHIPNRLEYSLVDITSKYNLMVDIVFFIAISACCGLFYYGYCVIDHLNNNYSKHYNNNIYVKLICTIVLMILLMFSGGFINNHLNNDASNVHVALLYHSNDQAHYDVNHYSKYGHNIYKKNIAKDIINFKPSSNHDLSTYNYHININKRKFINYNK